MAGSEMLVGRSSLIGRSTVIGDDADLLCKRGRSMAYSQCDCSATDE